MLAKRIIPCLDVNHGRVVKGTNFVNLKDAGDPVEVAARYDEEGADELVYLDITASHEDRAIFMAGRDVQVHQLVGPLLIITRSHLDRVARILEVDEVGPL